MANVIRKGPCPHQGCGSSDAYATYDDGSTYCYSCKTASRTKGVPVVQPTTWKPVKGHFQELTDRKIREETCKHFGYQVGERDGRVVHIMNIRGERGQLVAQKFRTPEKEFSWQGQPKAPPFWGQWLYNGGKHLVITEGEIDAMSVAQSMAKDCKWPVVSLPNGAGSVRRAIEANYEWLDRFDRIVLMFDMDKPGRAAVAEAAPLLPMGKVAIANLPLKDANEVLKAKGPEALTRAFWNAAPWMPDGIVSGDSFTLDKVMQASCIGFPVPYPELQEMLMGLRKGEITLLTAGSGIGKSTWARELAYLLRTAYDLKIGNVFLEEPNVKTAQGYIAIHNNVPLGRLRANVSRLTPEQWQEGLEKAVHGGMWFYDHFGSLQSERLLSKLRYLAQVCKVDFIVLDHISIVTSGVESSSEGERKDIDILMTRLRTLAEETGVGIIAIVHLKRVKDKSFNEGSQISLSDLRGSASLEQLSDNVVALERDQQGDAPNLSTIRVLKCRETGETGEADMLEYDKQTGRLVLADKKAPVVAPTLPEVEEIQF